MSSPFSNWGKLNEQIIAQGLSFSNIKDDLLAILEQLDNLWRVGRIPQGKYRQKGNMYRDTIISLIIARCKSKGISISLKERALRGRTDLHKVDFAYPLEGDPVVAGEVKAIGSPEHIGFDERHIGIDIDKRVKEVKYTPIDLKRKFDPLISKDWFTWIDETQPKFYVFWIMRQGEKNSLNKILGKVASIREYANGVSAVIYAPVGPHYQYVFLGSSQQGILPVDDLVDDICNVISGT